MGTGPNPVRDQLGSAGCGDRKPRCGDRRPVSEHHGPEHGPVVLPFIIFTAIWGSTWIVIRGQLGTVPAQWSVTYRFVIAAIAMAGLAIVKRDSLRLDRQGVLAVAVLGFCQFCINFDAVYLAERHITSGVVATVFALLL